MKKIATVSVLAIMAVSAARADIASTSYVDKAKTAVEGQVSTLAGRVTTAEGKITTAEGKITTAEGKISTLEGTVGQHTTSIEKNTEDIATNAEAIEKMNAGNLVINDGSIAKEKLAQTLQDEITGATTGVSTNAEAIETIESTMATDAELKVVSDNLANNYTNTAGMNQAIATATQDMAKTTDIGEGTLTVTIDGANAGTFNANAADNGTIAIAVPSTYVNETELGTALAPYAKTSEVAGTYATQTALTEGLAEKVSTADVANLSVSHAETAGSATTAAGYTTGGAIAQALAGKVDDNEINDMATKTYVGEQLGSYSTTAQMNTELAKKLDDTAAGSATLPIYIDTNGVAQTITSYSGKAASAGQADSATTATTAINYDATNGTIKTKFESVDDALENVAAFGEVPPVPDECKTTDPNGNATMDCTLVMKYNPGTSKITPTWTKVAY